MADIHVKSSPRTQMVEEAFKSLDFAHRVRLAADTLIHKAVEDGHDITMHVGVGDADNKPKATFIITVVLKEEN